VHTIFSLTFSSLSAWNVRVYIQIHFLAVFKKRLKWPPNCLSI
jgi:hypothetical protein